MTRRGWRSFDQYVIQTLASHAADEPLTDRIGLWRSYRCPQHLYPPAPCHTLEALPVLPVVVPEQESGLLFIRCRFSHLLSYLAIIQSRFDQARPRTMAWVNLLRIALSFNGCRPCGEIATNLPRFSSSNSTWFHKEFTPDGLFDTHRGGSAQQRRRKLGEIPVGTRIPGGPSRLDSDNGGHLCERFLGG